QTTYASPANPYRAGKHHQLSAEAESSTIVVTDHLEHCRRQVEPGDTVGKRKQMERSRDVDVVGNAIGSARRQVGNGNMRSKGSDDRASDRSVRHDMPLP